MKERLLAVGSLQSSTQTELSAAKDELSTAKGELSGVKKTLENLREEVRPQDLLKARISTIEKQLGASKEEAETLKGELAALKMAVRPQHLLKHQMVALEKELKASKEEAMKYKQEAVSAHKNTVQAQQQRAQLQSAYNEVQHTVTSFTEHDNHLKQENWSVKTTLDRTADELRTVKHMLATAKSDIDVHVRGLATQKKANDEMASELTSARSNVASLSADLEIMKIELSAYKKVNVTTASASNSPKGGSPSGDSREAKLAAWGNAAALIREDDRAQANANQAKIKAGGSYLTAKFVETYKHKTSRTNQTPFEAIEMHLSNLKGQSEAKDTQIATLKNTLKEVKSDLAAEKDAHVCCQKEVAAVQSALKTTQDLVKSARSDLCAAETAKRNAARIGCSCSQELRRSQALAKALGEELDESCMKTLEVWSTFHDAYIGLVHYPPTPETGASSLSSGGSGSDGSGSVEIRGTDGPSPPIGDKKWASLPGLARKGYAKRSLGIDVGNIFNR